MHVSFNKTWDNFYWHRGRSNNTPTFICSCLQSYANLYYPLYSNYIIKTEFKLTESANNKLNH